MLNIIFKTDQETLTLDLPPEKKVTFSGSRAIAKYEVPGHRPQYQDMGMEEQTCRLSGVIDGAGALSKAEKIRSLRDQGKDAKFIYGEISVSVRIRSFNYEYYRSDRVRYDMELVALADIELKSNTNPQNVVANQSVSNGVLDFTHYQTVAGDNLREIMSRSFGNPHDWLYVALWNGLRGPDLLEDSRIIKLPADRAALIKLKAALERKLPALAGGFIPKWKR